MSKQEKPKFPKGLIIYLIVVPVFLLFICFIATVSGSTINWGPFFLLILLFDGIPLLIYLCIYIIPWDKLNEKNLLKYIACSIAIIFVIGIISCGTCGGCGGDDGICDHAGCNKKATTTFGGEMEFCLEHYIEWSNRARK